MPTDFQREYLLRLPLPLAQLYSRAHNAKDARGRHDNAFYLCEALIKLTAAPAVACYLHETQNGQPRVEALDRLLVQLALPSLGQWLAILRELSRYFGARVDAERHPLGHLHQQLTRPRKDLPGLLALYQRIKNGPDGAPAAERSCSVLQLFDALVQYRNLVFGHGGPRFDSFFEKDMGPLLLPAVNDLLAENVVAWFGPPGTRLAYLTEIRTLDAAQTEIGVRELLGRDSERAAPLRLSAEQSHGLLPNRVAVLWPGRPVPLRLDPLLVYRETDQGEDVLFLNRDRNSRQVEYLSYFSGKTEREASMAAALAALLSLAAGKTVTEERLAEFQAQSLAETPSVEVLTGEQPLAGQVLGDYELLGVLGRGGMGVVYLARQLSLGRLVALKTLPADLGGDEVALARLRREIRALGRCDHPHIVKVLTSGTLPDGQPYYTMEYVPGCDLERVWQELFGATTAGGTANLSGSSWRRAVLSASQKQRAQTMPAPGATAKERLPLPPLPELPPLEDDPGGYVRRVVALVRDVARAVQAVHEQNLIHRDVKPANLMLTPDGERVVLMDFGLAKGYTVSRPLSTGGGLLGTLRYAAPEQLAAANLKVGPEADVRGLGVTLWELLTRRRLFAEAADETQLMKMVLTKDVPRLRSVEPSLDRDLEAIVARATERSDTDRIAKAGQLAEYLQLWLDGRPLPIRTPGVGELLRRWVREHKSLVSSAAAAVLTVVAVVAIAFVQISVALENEKEATGLADRRRIDAQDALAKKEAAEAKLKSQLSQAAGVYCDRSDVEFRRGNVADSLNWMLRAYETAKGADDPRESSYRRLLAGQSHASGRALVHKDAVVAVAFSPDGGSILTGSKDQTARLWDATTGKPIGEPLRHEGAVLAVAFSPDGRRVLTGSVDKTARLWDAATGKPIGEPLGYEGFVNAVAFSPDGRRVLTGSKDNTAQLWDAATGKPMCEPLRHDGAVMAVAFSPDGRRVCTGSERGRVQLWDATTGKPIGERGTFGNSVSVVAFSPDGRSVLTSGGKTVYLSDAATSHLTGRYSPNHEDRVSAVVFSPDGRRILTGSVDKTARLWDAATGKPIGEPLRHEGAVLAVAFSPDGRSVLTSSKDQTARLWDAATGKPIGEPFRHEGEVVAVTFSPDGNRVLTGSTDNTARLWDTAIDKAIGEPLRHEGEVVAVAFSPDGNRVLTGSTDKTARLWVTTTGKAIGEPLRHEGEVVAVAFSPDGNRVLTGSTDQTARLWDAATGKPIGEPLRHEEWVRAVAFSPDGRSVLTGSKDKTARLWDAATGKPIGEPLRHEDAVLTLAFSPTGHSVLTGSADKTARLWDAATGKPRGAPLRHDGEVNAVAFSSDGRSVLTGSLDSAARERLWDLATGKVIGEPLRDEYGVSAVAFSSDGRRVLTGGWHKTARLWEVVEPAPDDVVRLRTWVHIRTRKAFDEQGVLRPLTQADWLQAWKELEAHGGDWQTKSPSGRWHLVQAAEAERSKEWFAVHFHLRYLLAEPLSADIDDARPVELAQSLAQSKAWDSTAACELLGTALYRAGDPAKAVTHLNEAVEAHKQGGSVWTQLFLAMAHHQLGDAAKAQDWFQKADAQMRKGQDDKTTTSDWQEHLREQKLRQEAADLLKAN